MDFMKDLPDKRYDLAIVDPPYGIGNFSPTGGSAGTSCKGNHWDIKWNDYIPESVYFAEISRISDKQIIWGANYYNCFFNGGAVVWYKGKINPVFSQCEIASLSFQKRVDYVHIDWQAGFSRKKEGETIHPCQKPVALYKWLLTNYAKPGQTIFDSHVGSGSLRIACHELGFDFEGCEIDKDYWEAQEARYQNHIKQAELFDKTEVQRIVYKEGVL
jgi:site-specific DNA-methyltransferase (adenine-specific)